MSYVLMLLSMSYAILGIEGVTYLLLLLNNCSLKKAMAFFKGLHLFSRLEFHISIFVA